MVLIGVGKYAYRREDGVYVVPIGLFNIFVGELVENSLFHISVFVINNHSNFPMISSFGKFRIENANQRFPKSFSEAPR